MGREDVDLKCWNRERTHLKLCAHRLILYKLTGAGEESNPRPSLRSQERTNSAKSMRVDAQFVQTYVGGGGIEPTTFAVAKGETN